MIAPFLDIDRHGRPQKKFAEPRPRGVALIGAVAMPEYLLMTTVFISGMCLLGGQIGLNALAGTIYPTFVRSSGAGWALGIGRIGSILGPVIGGVLIGMNLSTPWLFVCAAIPGACCAVAVLALQAAVTRKSARDAEPEQRAGKLSRPAFRSDNAEAARS